MKLFYISHSCFVIESNQTRLAFDPWITSTAYNKQWYLHPKPVDISAVVNADVVLISHGHEDHFNSESLQLIQKRAHVFVPFNWRKGKVSYLNHLGFEEVTETISFRKYTYKNIHITYIAYSLESVIVVECEGMVIVNINDALNSNHETAVDFLLREIKSRWKKIDFLLSGWSGAGYFPNKVHFKGKDDWEVARIREQYFADNFCRFTKYFQPEIAIAFAPGFVLLNNENRWINEIKFPREIVETYYRENFDSQTTTQFPITFPGDYFVDKSFVKLSPYHSKSEKEIYKNLELDFKNDIVEANHFEYMRDDEINILENKLYYWMNKNITLYPSEVKSDVVFSIKMTDVLERPYLNIKFESSRPVISRSNSPKANDRLLIEIRARLLSLNLDKDWGGDLLSIGYGINITVFEELSLEKNLDIVCVRLISRFPIFKDDYLANFPRLLKYYLSNRSISNLWMKQKLKLRPYVNKYPFNERDHWITYNKCELCKVCRLPEMDFAKMEKALGPTLGLPK